MNSQTEVARMVTSFPPELRTRFTEWQTSLLKDTKDTGTTLQERQEELLASFNNGPAVASAYLERELNFKKYRETEFLPLGLQLTKGEASNPPLAKERDLYNLWENKLTPAQACQPLYWYLTHTSWIRQGVLGNDLTSTFAITGHSNDADKYRDSKVRSVLRRLGGLPVARGNVSVFSDCPLSRAWWRRRMAISVAEHSKNSLTVDAAHEAIHKNALWEALVLNSLRRVTVVNHPRIRAGIVAHFATAGNEVKGAKEASALVINVARRCQFYTPQNWQDTERMVEEAATFVKAQAAQKAIEDQTASKVAEDDTEDFLPEEND